MILDWSGSEGDRRRGAEPMDTGDGGAGLLTLGEAAELVGVTPGLFLVEPGTNFLFRAGRPEDPS